MLDPCDTCIDMHETITLDEFDLRLLTTLQENGRLTNAQRFRALIAGLPESRKSYAVTGDTDYQLKAVLPDPKTLAALINEAPLPHDSVARVRSGIVLERLKETGHLPVRASPAAGR